MIKNVCNTDHSGTNGDTQNQGASSNRPDDHVRTSDLQDLYERMTLEMRNNTQQVTGAIKEMKDEMKLLKDQYEQLNTKYVKLLERMCGDESRIGEREHEFQQLLEEKEALQQKLENSNVNKEEIEEELKKEKIKNKEWYDENEPRKKKLMNFKWKTRVWKKN